ncbi:hypothetical protein BASA81_008876 [Batrachochytrium salamandrivorans]|nr:hypothetical protein BASA81_008876 [Batrachochytrium salamandrivorans]
MSKSSKKNEEKEELVRIAIVDAEKCKPNKCKGECKKGCPVNKTGKQCITVSPTSPSAMISEPLCIGCGICVKKCPFGAIQIINLPANLNKETTHRYGENSFKLHRLPMPRPGQVLGLVGSNGTGKSTAMKILAGKLKPNLGKFTSPPEWTDILAHFRGNELQNYFTKVLQDDIKCIIKPQYVDHLPRATKGRVEELMMARTSFTKEFVEEIMRDMDLLHVRDRGIDVLSGGELQRFAIALLAVQKADVYMFDEPSSYLDIKQRLNAAWMIRRVIDISQNVNSYVLCVEHDLSVLDYLSDYICCLYGEPGAYGVVTMPFAVRDGINIFLGGFIPTENLRFRSEALTFKVAASGLYVENREGGGDTEEAEAEEPSAPKGGKTLKKKKEREVQVEVDEDGEKVNKTDAPVPGTRGVYKYPAMSKVLHGETEDQKKFELHVEAGDFKDSEIIVCLGENGGGKTTLIRMLAGLLEPDCNPGESKPPALPKLAVSYKPQKISPKFPGSVRELMLKRIPNAYNHEQFKTDVIRPMKIENIIDQDVKNLSGGELQRVALTICLGTPADIYLIDEPSAYLDSEQRVIAAKMVKRFILHAKKTAFIVEHDFIFSTFVADRVVVFDGKPGVKMTAKTPQDLLSGMNLFLRNLQVTFRRDPANNRPRINKKDSVKDQEQKKSGNFFFMDSDGL